MTNPPNPLGTPDPFTNPVAAQPAPASNPPTPSGAPRGTSTSRAAQKEAKDRKHVHQPFGIAKPTPTDNYGTPATNKGTNYPMPVNTMLYAMVKSKVVFVTDNWDHGGLVVLEALEDRGSIKTGDRFGYGHTISELVSSDAPYVGGLGVVEKGHAIAKSGHVTKPRCHFWMQRPKVDGTGSAALHGNTDGAFVVDYAYGGAVTDSPTNSSGSPTSTSGSSAASYTSDQVAKAAAFSTILSFPSAVNSVESNALIGQRSLLNDQELLPFIEQICGASLRQFMSMPNGKFYAFYPDYFGGFHRAPYWEIADVEIMSGRIDLSDDNLATHVFVVGDTMPSQGGAFGFGTVDYVDEMETTGVINIFNAFQTGFLNGKPSDGTATSTENKSPDELDHEGALRFLNKYGARKYMESAAAVRSPIYETFLAFQRFCMLWSKQFVTSFEFTFMPELFPGGIVAFPEHGLQCYVEEVVHAGSYTDGFTTVAQLSSPAALKDANTDPDKEWIHSGMIRAFVNETVGTPLGATDAKPAPATRTTT